MIRNKIIRIVFILLILMIVACLLGEVTLAATDVGRTSASFLQIGVGARAAGMGGAYTAVSEGAIASYWNPAGLCGLDVSEISVGHFSWYQDITVEQGSFAFPVGDRAVMAAFITYLNYGTIEGYDINGIATGELTAHDLVGGLSLGYGLSDNLSLGLTAKGINQRLDQYSGSAFAVDLGVKYTFSRLDLAIVWTNLGTDIQFDRQKEKLPSAVRFGVAARPLNTDLTASIDVERRLYGDIVIRQGLEVGFDEQYFLRTGYDYLPGQDGRDLATGIALGAGVRFDFAVFNYAYTPNDKATMDDVHRFSLVLKIGQ